MNPVVPKQEQLPLGRLTRGQLIRDSVGIVSTHEFTLVSLEKSPYIVLLML